MAVPAWPQIPAHGDVLGADRAFLLVVKRRFEALLPALAAVVLGVAAHAPAAGAADPGGGAPPGCPAFRSSTSRG